MDFETIWTEHVTKLSGKTIPTFSGKKNTILSVSGDGITRITSQADEPKSIGIEPFRWAVDRLLKSGRVTRQEIHAEFSESRCSSGVFAVLSQVPLFEVAPGSPATLVYKAR